MRRTILGTVLLLMGGCGADSFLAASDPSLTGGARTPSANFGEPDPTAPGIDPGSPSLGRPTRDLRFQIPERGSDATPILDSLLFWAFDLGDPQLLSLFADSLALDILSPAPSRGGFTYLELVCIDSGQPEHVCRRRYGGGLR